MGGWVRKARVVDCTAVSWWVYDPHAEHGLKHKPGHEPEPYDWRGHERQRFTREEWVTHLRKLNGIVPGERDEERVQRNHTYRMSVVGGSLEQALCGLPYDERTYMGMELDDTERRRRFAVRPVPWVGMPLPSVGALVHIEGMGNSVRVVRVAYGYPGRMRISGG